ncbi:MAG: hypothetical protein Q4A37_00955 [Candidatus Saccharibacteria bacterium]|nr:hypothetical protein [Candidatus Saccharibacteria bacterium]
MGDVISFPKSSRNPGHVPENPGSAEVINLIPQEYYKLEGSINASITALHSQKESEAPVSDILRQLDEKIAEIHTYRPGVPEYITLGMGKILTEANITPEQIEDCKFIIACLVETVQQPNSHDPEQQQRALAAAALLPYDGTRLYGLAHYQTPDTTPPSIT